MASKLIVFFLSISISTVFSETIIPSYRVLDGVDVAPGECPWAVSIRLDGAHVCMGSIISNHYIITAAHCVSSVDISRVTARIGSVNQFAGGQINLIKSITINPSYENFLHDIALLKVDRRLEFNDKIIKISWATEDDVIESGALASVSGWGLQENGSSPYKLINISMQVLNNSECEMQAGYGYNSVICLTHPEKSGICRGDDGAGVINDMKLVGVASFFFGRGGTKYPDVASKISYYSSWIKSVLQED